jgi:peptidoglycan/LPS O-acetylase OafA/YrhL
MLTVGIDIRISKLGVFFMLSVRRTTILDRFSSVSFKGPGFDQIRLAAAMVVLAHHSWWGVNDTLYRYSHEFVHLGLFAVIVFFCISGFLVTRGLVRTRDIIRFGVNRALRILPALIAVVIASMFVLGPLVTKVSLVDYLSDPQLYCYARNIATLMAHYLPGVTDDGHPVIINGALWTLNIEICAYIALALLCFMEALRHRMFALTVFIVTYFLYAVLTIDATFGAMLSTRFVNFVGLFVYFIAGSCLFLYGDKIIWSGTFAAAAFVLAIAGLAFGLGAIVLPVCVPYIVVYLGLSDLPGRGLFKHDLSYGVYLIHSPVIVAVTLLLGLRAGWPVALISAVITLMLAYLSWIYVERPALRQKKVVSDWLGRLARPLTPLQASFKRLPLRDASKSALGE